MSGLLHGDGPPGPIPFGLLIIVFYLDLLDSDGFLDGLLEEDGETLEEGLVLVVEDDEGLDATLRVAAQVSESAVEGVPGALIVDAASVPLHLEAVRLENRVLYNEVLSRALLGQVLRLADVQAEGWVSQQNFSRFPIIMLRVSEFVRESGDVVLIVPQLVEVIVYSHLGPVAVQIHPMRESSQEWEDQHVAISF